jgi:hypothetical protein
MPLKLTDINNPASTIILNGWAQGQEQTVDQHSMQIKTLTNILSDLLKKNPSLVKPNGIK